MAGSLPPSARDVGASSKPPLAGPAGKLFVAGERPFMGEPDGRLFVAVPSGKLTVVGRGAALGEVGLCLALRGWASSGAMELSATSPTTSDVEPAWGLMRLAPVIWSSPVQPRVEAAASEVGLYAMSPVREPAATMSAGTRELATCSHSISVAAGRL